MPLTMKSLFDVVLFAGGHVAQSRSLAGPFAVFRHISPNDLRAEVACRWTQPTLTVRSSSALCRNRGMMHEIAPGVGVWLARLGSDRDRRLSGAVADPDGGPKKGDSWFPWRLVHKPLKVLVHQIGRRPFIRVQRARSLGWDLEMTADPAPTSHRQRKGTSAALCSIHANGQSGRHGRSR